MTSYKVLVEGIFVKQGNDRRCLGFFSTFFVAANSAKIAKHKVSSLLLDRVTRNGLKQGCFIFKSRYRIKDIWEVEGRHVEDVDGFSFYKISIFDVLVRLIAYQATKKIKPGHVLEIENFSQI